MAEGYIKLSRNILDWGWYGSADTFRVFLHILLSANYVDGNFKGIVIKRGQMATSHEKLAEKLDLSVQNVRTALKHLKQTGEIETERHSKFQLITVKNYDVYQGDCLTINQQSTNNQLTINQQSTNSQLTTIKERKNNKKGRKKEIYIPDELSEAMGEFIEMRKNIKKPMTDEAVKRLLEKLSKMGNLETQKAILYQSIDHCWQSVYELKKESKQEKATSYDMNEFKKRSDALPVYTKG